MSKVYREPLRENEWLKRKVAEYEKLDIPEYWIVDYRALGGIRYIDSPKVPTVWIYNRVDGEFQAGVAFQEKANLIYQLFSE